MRRIMIAAAAAAIGTSLAACGSSEFRRQSRPRRFGQRGQHLLEGGASASSCYQPGVLTVAHRQA